MRSRNTVEYLCHLDYFSMQPLAQYIFAIKISNDYDIYLFEKFLILGSTLIDL